VYRRPTSFGSVSPSCSTGRSRCGDVADGRVEEGAEAEHRHDQIGIEFEPAGALVLRVGLDQEPATLGMERRVDVRDHAVR